MKETKKCGCVFDVGGGFAKKVKECGKHAKEPDELYAWKPFGLDFSKKK